MIFDLLVKQRLRNGRIVDFAVAVAAIADEIDDNIGAELIAIFRREAPDAKTASTSSALTWKIGIDCRRAMQAANRVECTSVELVVKPSRLLTIT